MTRGATNAAASAVDHTHASGGEHQIRRADQHHHSSQPGIAPAAGILTADSASSLAALVQPKLHVGPAGDAYEQEADRIAAEVVSRLRRSPASDLEDAGDVDTAHADGPLQVSRQTRPGAIGAEGGAVDADLESSLRSASSGGAALAEPIRRSMEGAMDADFSAVRVHTGAESAELNQSISADAFTLGNDIFFRDGMPDTSTSQGQSLLAHELVHTMQQGGSARRSTVQRKKSKKPDPTLDVFDDWVKYSGGGRRSSELKQIDRTLAQWLRSGRQMQGAIDANITELQAIFDAILAWQQSKSGPSQRDVAIADLYRALTPAMEQAVANATKRLHDDAIAQPLFDKFKSIDAETGRFAEKHVGDIKLDRFRPDSQSPGLMANANKNNDGTLTDAGMNALDALQVEEANKLKETARNAAIVLQDGVDLAKVQQTMESNTNELTDRSTLPELKNLLEDNGEEAGEVTQPLPGTPVTVTYDKSDVHAVERIAAVKRAIELVSATRVPVPRLEVYLPKLGRSLTVKSDCTATFGAKIADAVFHPPTFLAVSSANTGNAKTDKVPSGDLKFLSASLGADDALVHTIIHEIGHAAHYNNARGRFYNLNFSKFKGTARDGRLLSDMVAEEVSGYGAGNPREMVAEVFVATVTGKKTFSDEIWQIYLSFGGADPR